MSIGLPFRQGVPHRALPRTQAMADPAGDLAAAAAANVARPYPHRIAVHTWDEFRLDTVIHWPPPPNKMHWDALHYLTWCFQHQATGVPLIRPEGLSINLEEESIQIFTPMSDWMVSGYGVWYLENCDEDPWRWRSLFAALDEAPPGFYEGGGVILLRLGAAASFCLVLGFAAYLLLLAA